jgi:hypothetical protein
MGIVVLSPFSNKKKIMILPPPNTKVLAFQKEEDDEITPIIAVHIPKFYRKLEKYEFEDYDHEYNNDDDDYYWLPGWYECVNNWGFSYIKITLQNSIIFWRLIEYYV